MFPFFLQTAIYPRRGSFNHPRKVKFSATARNKTNFSQMTEPNQAYSSTWIRAKRSTHASDSLLRPHRAGCSFDSSKVIPSTTRSMFTAHSEEMFTTLPNIVPLALWVWPCHWIVSLTQSITHKRCVVHSALLKSLQIRSNATASDYHCCWETWLFSISTTESPSCFKCLLIFLIWSLFMRCFEKFVIASFYWLEFFAMTNKFAS